MQKQRLLTEFEKQQPEKVGVACRNMTYRMIYDELSERRRMVLDVIRRHFPKPVCARDIAWELGKPLHTVSGRISELKKMGLVVETGEIVVRDCGDGRLYPQHLVTLNTERVILDDA